MEREREPVERAEVDAGGVLRIRGAVSGLSLQRAFNAALEAHGSGNKTRAWYFSPNVTRDRTLLASFWTLSRFVEVDGQLSILGLPVEIDSELPDGAFELREQL